MDDYYIMDRSLNINAISTKQCIQHSFILIRSGIVMLQTTNSVLNKTLYDSVTNQALLAWHRVRAANWMASGGEEWAKYLAEIGRAHV